MTASALHGYGGADVHVIAKELFIFLLDVCIIPLQTYKHIVQKIQHSMTHHTTHYWHIPNKLNIKIEACSICSREEVVAPCACECGDLVVGECTTCFSAFCEACGYEDCVSWMKCNTCEAWYSIPEIMYIVLQKHQELFSNDDIDCVWTHLMDIVDLYMAYRSSQICCTVSNLVPFHFNPEVLGATSDGTLGLAYAPKAALRPEAKSYVPRNS